MMYERDIAENPHLNEVGKYATQFSRNHKIPMDEVMRHPMVQAYARALQIEQDVGLKIGDTQPCLTRR